MILTVPMDEAFYPTLGPQVCDFIEQNLIYGPGDLRGQPVVLDDETIALIYRFYEVFPKGHPLEGRRRFKRCGLSLPKGLGKTEKAAWIAACELHPEAPVRCTGWTRGGDPIGGPVSDPYIPFVAYTEEQSDELAYGALKVMLEEGPLKDDFDIGLERIMRKRGDGKAVSLSSNPNSREGARTTFCVMDETHLWTLPRLKDAHKVMLNNLAKRKIADPWMIEITTAPEPGAGSVAEATMEYAQAVHDGRVPDASLFFFHRQSSDEHDLTTVEGARAAVVEASGPAASWRDIDAIVGLLKDPASDRSHWERVWCNRVVKASRQAFDVNIWRSLKSAENQVKNGDLITLGFDGAMFHDSVALVATGVESGYQWVPGVWERPYGVEEWQAPIAEIDATVRMMFARFRVWKMYADPPYWQTYIAQWAGEFGEDVVIDWYTNRRRPMALSLLHYSTSMKDGSIRHDGDVRYERHIGNSRKEELPGWVDDQGHPLWLIRKERPDSPLKIDAAMAGCLSWQARTDAVASGALTNEDQFQTLVLGRVGR